MNILCVSTEASYDCFFDAKQQHNDANPFLEHNIITQG